MTLNQTIELEADLVPATREQFILEHMPQVKLIARRIHARLPASISLDDLISAGVVGLMSAIDRYDSQRDVKLKTFAEYKIRGAILDTLRDLDWAPREQRRRGRLIEQAIGSLEREHQRTPDEQEIADRLGVSLSTYHKWLSDARGLTLGSLERSGEDADGADLLCYVADCDQKSPAEILEQADLERTLCQAIARMPKVERTVLQLYFYQELTLREIARIIDLHESRVSQLKTQAILRLRSFMQRLCPRAPEIS